jgi:hypothetical protein
LLGQHLTSNDSYVILDTCGLDVAAITTSNTSEASTQLLAMHGDIPSVLWYSNHVQVTHSGAAVWFGSPVATFQGGIYRLCWCADSFLCSIAEDFRVDVGSLLLLGPAPLVQHRTCVSGQTCVLVDMIGYGFSDDDQILLLDTCGMRANIQRTARVKTLRMPQINATVTWGDIPLTPMGGKYMMCWCAGAYQCSISENFQSRVGLLTMIGPEMRSNLAHPEFAQDRTCISGQLCAIDGVLGHLLQADDKFMILDTCGDNRTVIPRFVADGSNTMVAASGAGMGYGATHLTSAGGQYRLCWCAAGFTCSSADDFRVEAGGMTIVGPTFFSQDRTCVIGQTCLLDSIEGWHLHSGDALFILDTCGASASGSPFQLVPEFPYNGLDFLTSANNFTSMHTGMYAMGSETFSYDDQVITAPGGNYRMCWCAAGATCTTTEHFRLDIGRLTLKGPSTFGKASRSMRGHCGRTTPFNVYSVAHPPTELMLEVKQQTVQSCRQLCALADGTSLLGLAHLLHHSPSSNMTKIWSTSCSTVQSNDTGIVCQPCAAAEYADKGDEVGTCRLFRLCSLIADESNDFIVLLPDSPRALDQDRTCISGQACVMQNITGHLLAPADSFLVLETCAAPSSPTRFPNDGWANKVLGQGKLKECGCNAMFNGTADSDNDMVPDCNDECPHDPNKAEAGVCGCGVSDIDSDGDTTPDCVDQCPLHNTSIKASICGCGRPEVDSDSDGVPDCIDRCKDVADAQFDQHGNLHAGCAAADLDTDGDGVKDFLDQCPEDANKTMALACGCGNVEADYDGDGVPDCAIDQCPRDKFKTKRGICGCGVADSDADNDQTPDCNDNCPGHSDTLYASFDVSFETHVVTAQGGQYRLCWCAAWYGCSLTEQFRVDVGGLTLIGPAPLTQDRTCISGHVCNLDGFTGMDIGDGDKFVVLETCALNVQAWIQRLPYNAWGGVLHDLPGETWTPYTGFFSILTSTGSSLSWGTTWITAPGGRYRLCWCAEGQICSTAEDFRVDTGMLTLIGPSPLSESRTCVAGQTCALDNIQGQHLEDTDQFLILLTCGGIGEKTTLPRFPNTGQSMDVRSHGTALNWNLQHLSVAGGQYRLCWCYSRTTPTTNTYDIVNTSLLSGNLTSSTSSADNSTWMGSVCSAAEGFRVDVGGVEIIGPTPLQQDRTCVSGQTCEFEPFIAQHSNAGDTMMVLDTCGLAKLWSNAEWIRGHCGRTGEWGMEVLRDFQVVDIFENAWGEHGHTEASCRELCESYNVPNIPEGAKPEASKPCVAAMFKDHDTSYHTVNHSAVLWHPVGHCVLYSKCSPVSDESSEYIVFFRDLQGIRYPDGWVPRFPGLGFQKGVSVALAQGPATDEVISWGSIPMTAAGGYYRMCWCAAGYQCSIAEDFRVDTGGLTVVGPSPLFIVRTCISGQSCQLPDIWGTYLSTGDYIVITDTCGEMMEFQRFPSIYAANVSTGAAALTFSGSTIVSAQGGLYRLCWCADTYQCETIPDFRVDMGTLILVGPAPLYQDRTCVTGQKCSVFETTGFHLQRGDGLRILDTCGLYTGYRGWPNYRFFTETGGASFSNISTTKGVPHWETSFISARGGIYRLCWCAKMYDCTRFEEFYVDMGALRLLGPSDLDQQHTCVSGQSCVLRHFYRDQDSRQLQITELNQGDQMRLLDTCGVASVTPRFADDALATVVSSSGTTFSWGTAVLSGPSGEYRLCWCSRGFDCDRAHGFRVDVGELIVVGPQTVYNARTCVAGNTCWFSLEYAGHPSYQGSYEGSVLILDTCGLAPLVVPPLLRFPRDALAVVSPFAFKYDDAQLNQTQTNSSQHMNFVPQANQGALEVYWGQALVTTPGGKYRICWCADAYDCGIEDRFRVDIGELTVIGPSKLTQHRTCVSGQTCVMDGFVGQYLQAADQYMILETCGTKHGYLLRFTEEGELTRALEGFDPSWEVSVWGKEPITTQGGQYRICWCSADDQCSRADHFEFDMGELLLIGISPLYQDQTCVAGQTCAFDSLTGQSLSSHDRIIVLDTCGRDSPMLRWVGYNLPENSSIELNVSDPFPFGYGLWDPLAEKGRKMNTWEEDAVTASGGQYRLCWCAAGYPCGAGEHFRVDMGGITLIGPRIDHQRTCVSGQDCVFGRLLGQGLHTNDRIVVLDTCGELSAGHYPGIKMAYGGELVRGPMPSNTKDFMSFGTVPVTAPGGIYQLCWCAAGYPCSKEFDYRVTMGELLIVGPSPLTQDRTCVSGQRCVTHSVYGPGLQAYKLVDVTGFRFKQDGNIQYGIHTYHIQVSYDFVASNPNAATWTNVLTPGCTAVNNAEWQTCTWLPVSAPYFRWLITSKFISNTGLLPPRPREVEFFGSMHTDVSGWALGHSPSWVVYASGIPFSSSYDAGKLMDRILTNSSQWWPTGLVSGWNVVFDFTASDHIAILDTCGTFLTTLPRVGDVGFIDQGVASNSYFDMGPVHVTAQGGNYRLCWCSRGFSCSTPEEFRTDFGEFTLIGPAPLTQDRTCVSGQTCNVQGFLGNHLVLGDSVFVLNTCGLSTYLPGRRPWFGIMETQQPSGATIRFENFTVSSTGGEYRLCWCAANYSCSRPIDFRTDAGMLTIIGVAPLSQHRTCVAGQTCKVDGLLGYHLSDSDRVIVVDTCSDSQQTRFPNAGVVTSVLASGAIISWGGLSNTTQTTASGGQYRMCWCAGGFTCEIASDFQVDMGELVIVGPWRPEDTWAVQTTAIHDPLHLTRGQDRTCVSGQTCMLEDIKGTYLTHVDHFLMLNTCGSEHGIPRIPRGGDLFNVSLACACARADYDRDGDSFKDCFDVCPHDPNKTTSPGPCGCGFNETDTDGDSIPNCLDLCPLDPHKSLYAGLCGCGVNETDTDHDGTPDCFDSCPTDATKTLAGFCGTPSWMKLENFNTNQASTKYGGISSRAVDGNSNPDFYTGHSCTHTEFHFNPWWFIDLGNIFTISRIKVTNRGDCCTERLNLFSVWVTDANAVNYTQGTRCANQVQIGIAETREVDCTAQGRMIWIVMEQKFTALTLCEVGVFAAPAILNRTTFGGFHYDSDSECLSSGLGTACGCGVEDKDSDGDGRPDCIDQCPHDPAKIRVGVCGCGETEDDSDSDGTLDCLDQCPLDPAKTMSGICGCGNIETDSDLDGIPDCNDICHGLDNLCPNDPSTCCDCEGSVCACANEGEDWDQDGTLDCKDLCPYDPTKTHPGQCGCAVVDKTVGTPPANDFLMFGPTEVDTDLDGYADCIDQCPNDNSKQHLGVCGCGVADTDSDSDGVPDCIDQCPHDVTKTLIGVCGCGHHDVDSDEDGVPDCLDRCPLDGNLTVRGVCGCDMSDEDFDGVLDCVDECPADPLKTLPGVCGCGVADADIDGDGIPDCNDLCPTIDDRTYSGTTVSFGDVRITSAGGQYRFCWCAGTFGCTSGEQFTFDVGEITVIGPQTLQQDRTCVAGQTCTLEGVRGTDISQNDTYSVLHTCGVTLQIPGLSFEGEFIGIQDDLSGLTFGRDVDSLKNVHLSFGNIRLTAMGGNYRLCWCAFGLPCAHASEHVVDFGEFHIIGPSPLKQDQTCISGHTCKMDGLTGHYLHSTDRLVVLDTCATATALPRFPQAAHIVDVQTSGTTMQFSTMQFAGTDYIITGAGGQYRLCWCAAVDRHSQDPALTQTCSTFEEFFVDFGEITILGPTPLSQDRTCVSGQTCVLEGLLGQHVLRNDSFWLLDTCAITYRPIRVPYAGRIEGERYWTICGCPEAHNDTDFDGTIDCLDDCPLDSNKAAIGICGCGMREIDSDGDGTVDCLDECKYDSNKTVAGVCGCGVKDIDSDGDGTLDCRDMCPHDPTKTNPGACGCGVSDAIDADSDGVPDCHDTCPGVPDFSQGTCGCVQGFHDDDADGTVNCEDACPRYPFKIVVGVCGCGVLDVDTDEDGTPDCIDYCANDTTKIAPGTCGCGESEDDHDGDGYKDCIDSCPFDPHKRLAGYCGCGVADTDSDNDGTPDCYDKCDVTYIAGSRTSGTHDKLPPALENMVYSFGSIPISAPGGQYRLCWCSSLLSCEVEDDFRVDVGALTIIGPSPLEQHRTCVSGRTCLLEGFIGTYLGEDDTAMILDTCALELYDPSATFFEELGNSDPLSYHVPAFYIDRRVHGNTQNETRYYSTGVTTQGGEYRLCWCAGGQGCSVPQAFGVDMGRITVSGPAPLTQDRTCVAGQSCILQNVLGHFLNKSDIVLALDTCVSGSGPRRAHFRSEVHLSSPFGGSLFISPTPFTSPGGQYRLCWCAATGVGSAIIGDDIECETKRSFYMDIGEITLLGPTPLQQHRTCVLGQTCHVENFVGQNLHDADRMLVLDTCNPTLDVWLDPNNWVSHSYYRLDRFSVHNHMWLTSASGAQLSLQGATGYREVATSEESTACAGAQLATLAACKNTSV